MSDTKKHIEIDGELYVSVNFSWGEYESLKRDDRVQYLALWALARRVKKGKVDDDFLCRFFAVVAEESLREEMEDCNE